MLRVLDPALLTAGLQVVALGVPPEALIEAQARVNALVREIAHTYVQMFLDSGQRAFVDAGAPPEQLQRVQDTVARLQPAAAQALLAAFRTEMAAAVEQTIAAVLTRLAEGRDLLPRHPLAAGLLGLLACGDPPIADDGEDDEADQDRRRDEEAERGDVVTEVRLDVGRGHGARRDGHASCDTAR